MKHILGLASNVKEDSLLTGLVQFFIDVGVLSEDSTNISDILTVDEFQIKIFIFLIGFFMLNILGIFVAWNYYGPRIADRLMKPGNFHLYWL